MAIFGLDYLAFAWSAEGATPPPTTTVVDHAWAGPIVDGSGLAVSLWRGFVERPTARRIGHALCALVIGLAGCALGYALAGRELEGGS